MACNNRKRRLFIVRDEDMDEVKRFHVLTMECTNNEMEIIMDAIRDCCPDKMPLVGFCSSSECK